MEAPGLHGSCREVEAQHHEKSPKEVTGESANQLQQEIPTFWRCQYDWIITKISRGDGVEPPLTKEIS